MASLKKRNGNFYAQWYIGSRQKRASLDTSSLQIAKERLRQLESRLAQGHDDPLPTRTPIGELVAAYVQQIRGVKTFRSAQTDVFYLRQMLGVVCPELELSRRNRTPAAAKRPPARGADPKDTAPMQIAYAEQITTAQIADFIGRMVRTKGLAAKTANRYREIMNRLFNWSMREGRVRMPGDKNPAARLTRYRERAPEIVFMTLPEIREQLETLEHDRQLQTVLAVYFYAGLRREEALWLTTEDVDLRPGAQGMIRIRAKTVGGESWQPKTKVNRAVPISTDLARFLLRYRPRPTAGGWYFPSPKGRRYDADNFSTDLRAAQEQAGLRWSCLHFRHTFGSQLAQKGVSLFKIATLMGNSPEICRRHYAALVPEAMGADVEFCSTNHH